MSCAMLHRGCDSATYSDCTFCSLIIPSGPAVSRSGQNSEDDEVASDEECNQLLALLLLLVLVLVAVMVVRGRREGALMLALMAVVAMAVAVVVVVVKAGEDENEIITKMDKDFEDDGG